MSRGSKLLAGLKTSFAASEVLKVAGADRPVPDLVQAFEQALGLYAAAESLHEQTKTAVEVRDTAAPGFLKLMDNLEKALSVWFGPASETLTAFGMTPERPRKRRSSAQKAAAAKKAAATRAAEKPAGEGRAA